MRVSLTARYVSHPTIDFGPRHVRGPRRRLGLVDSRVVFHRPFAARAAAPTIDALRSLTSQFSFPSVGSAGRVGDRRAVHPPGSSRVRRA